MLVTEELVWETHDIENQCQKGWQLKERSRDACRTFTDTRQWECGVRPPLNQQLTRLAYLYIFI